MLADLKDRLPQASGNVFLCLKNTAFGVVLLTVSNTAVAQHTPMPTIDLYAGMHRIVAELAVKPDERAQGLMGRKSLAEQRGMLFVFDRSGKQCFWMRNTFVPLSIAFLRDDGSIVNIEDMQPQSDTDHCSDEPVRLALEVNQGWFAKRNISPEMTIRGIPTLR